MLLLRITYPGKFVLKTTNGGLNWVELPFPNFHEHGIGFINANTGWIGGDYNPTYGTTDGGQTWFNANIGQFLFGFQFFGTVHSDLHVVSMFTDMKRQTA